MEDPEYLQPGFDPTTLKVAELRGILLEHNVDYPSSAKKAQLVDLFTQHVAPKARRILNARSRVKASGRGIIDAGSDATPPVEATPRRRSSRRATRLGTADTEEDDEEERAPVLARPQRRSASVKRVSGKHTRGPETDKSEFEDQEPPKSIRKTRKGVSRQSIIPKTESPGLPPPELKYENTDEEAEEPVFSSHNPFQSGSSPATKSPDRADRRKVGGSFRSQYQVPRANERVYRHCRACPAKSAANPYLRDADRISLCLDVKANVTPLIHQPYPRPRNSRFRSQDHEGTGTTLLPLLSRKRKKRTNTLSSLARSLLQRGRRKLHGRQDRS